MIEDDDVFTNEEIAAFIAAEQAIEEAEAAARTPEAIAAEEARLAELARRSAEYEAVRAAEKARVNALKARVIGILKDAGIEMSAYGCGCCGSPVVSFAYNGEVILDEEDQFNFETTPTDEED